jgi:DNA-binding NarL/FixJ family response regulator
VTERTEQLLEELVRLKVMSLRRDMGSQTEAILAFSESGFEPVRIAELLGTTPATVRAAKQKASKKPTTKKPRTKKNSDG